MTSAATPEAGLADGDGALARFDGPSGLVAAEDGTLFVADTKNHLVKRLTLASLLCFDADMILVIDCWRGEGERGKCDCRAPTFLMLANEAMATKKAFERYKEHTI